MWNACGCVGDLCLFECGDLFVSKINDVVPKIFDILSDSNVDWSVKVWSICIIGDLISAAKGGFEQHMHKAMQILGFASQWVIDYDKWTTDEDFTEYIMNLIQALIETYTTIIQSVDVMTQSMKEIVGENLNLIIEFALRCAHVDDFNPNLEWIKDIVGLLADIASLLDSGHW